MPSNSVLFEYMIYASSRRRHTRYWRDWSSDVFSSDLRGASRGTTGGAVGSWSGAGRGCAGMGWVLRAGPPSRPSRQRVQDRKSVVWGTSVDLGGRRIITKQFIHNSGQATVNERRKNIL